MWRAVAVSGSNVKIVPLGFDPILGQKQIFFTKNHTISSFPVKPGPSIILGNYQKKQSWRNDFIEAVHNGLKKIRMCIPIFYFLFFLEMIC